MFVFALKIFVSQKFQITPKIVHSLTIKIENIVSAKWMSNILRLKIGVSSSDFFFFYFVFILIEYRESFAFISWIQFIIKQCGSPRQILIFKYLTETYRKA